MNEVKEPEYDIQEYLSLLQAFKQLNSNIEIEEVFQNILRQTMQVVGAEAGTLWVLNAEKNEIEAVAAFGPSAADILNIKMDFGEGIVGKVVATGQEQLIKDVSKSPDWAIRVDTTSGFVTKSMITVPLTVKNEVLGALQLLNKKDIAFFSENDITLALALANQSALALKNSQMYDELYRILLSMIRTLAKVLDARDPYTAGHSERVAQYSTWIAERMGLDADTCEELYKAALLHDIGKIGIPDDILRKADKLTGEEYAAIKQHTVIGADILSNIEPRSAVERAIETARSHHERLDGSGYPEGLAGEDIPLFARIVGVADAFDAMTTVRSYSQGLTYLQGADELKRCKGTLFDEKAVEAFIEILEECQYQVEAYAKKKERGYRI